MNEIHYKQLLPQLRAKTNEDVWFAMHSAPAMPEYKLAGELVLAEREETAVRLRAKLAYRQSWIGIAIATGALVISLLTFFRAGSNTPAKEIPLEPKSQPSASTYSPAPSSPTPVPKSSSSATSRDTTAPPVAVPPIPPNPQKSTQP